MASVDREKTAGAMGEREPEAMQLRPRLSAEDRVEEGGDGGECEEQEYDPHLHRQLPKPTTDLETLVHLLKCSVGTGILAMPQAFGRAGVVTGALATLCVGALVTHCLHVLVRAQYAACARRRVPLLSYPEAMAAALEAGPRALRPLARVSAGAVDLFLVVYQLGICCVYVVFIAENVKKICDPYVELSVTTHMAFVLGPLVAFNLIPSLKLLAPFSALANVLTVVGLGVVVYYLVALEPVSREPLDLFGSAHTFPLFFGTMLFALTAVGVVVALENNMKTPKSFGTPCGVLNVGMSIIVLMYVSMGVLGAMFCGSACRDSVTLDLPEGPVASAATAMFAVAIFISYGLHCYVPVEVVWRGYVRPALQARHASPRRLAFAEYTVRVLLCLLTFGLAAAVPQLGLFISLFGALCLSALGLCFPAVMDSCVAYASRAGLARPRAIKNVLLFTVGLLGLVVGTYTALLNIARTFRTSDAATATATATAPPP